MSRTGPAVIGVDWYVGMMAPDRFGYLHPTGRNVGGHCVLLNGYNLKRRAFRVHQSWGEDWGDNGEAWLLKDDLARLLGQGGEVCVPVRRRR